MEKIKSKTVLQEYAKYLRDTLYTVNKNYGGIYWNLNQFYEEGRIEEIISKTASTENKKDVLSLIREDILIFFESNNYITPIQDVEQFCKIKERKQKLKKINSKKN